MKTIKILIALVLFAAGHIFAANVEDRHLSGFHAVDAAGSFDIYITQGSAESVKVDAPADVIGNVITEVKNGTLRIHSKDKFNWKNLFKNKRVSVYVTVKNIDDINLSGSGNITFKDGLKATNGDMHLHVSGSGNIEGKLTARAVDAGISGSGNLKLAGSTDDQNVSVSGSGNYSARDLTSSKANVSVSGSGNASVYCNNTLNAHVSGSGNVHYNGNPKNVSKSKSGSGSVSGS